MKKVFVALCMTGLLAAATSCKTSNNAATSTSALNGEWKITEVNGQNITKTKNPNEAFIGFDVAKKSMYGSTSCNRFFGELNADANKGTISFGNVGSTLMMCEDIKTEEQVLKAVNETKSYELKGGKKLTLKSADGKVLMTLQKRSK